MSKRWWIIFVVVLGLGCVCTIVGIKLYGKDSFIENLLPGAGVSLIVFAIAIVLIEGPVMTRERRLQKVVRMTCRDVMKINEEVAVTLVREMGEYLASRLGSTINLCGEERENWKAFKDLLRVVFQDARQVSVRGLPQSGRVSEEDYLSYVDAARRFMEQVGNVLGSSWEVQAELEELVEHRKKLNERIIEGNYTGSISDEKNRYMRLGAIGEAIIDLIEGCPRVKG